MIGIDTNVLARYYVQDGADAEAAKQHQAARRLMARRAAPWCARRYCSSANGTRGDYGFDSEEIAQALRPLEEAPGGAEWYGRILIVPGNHVVDRTKHDTFDRAEPVVEGSRHLDPAWGSEGQTGNPAAALLGLSLEGTGAPLGCPDQR
jgi:hypothetical protein